MKTEGICPSCGRPLAAGSPQGLCAGCLMKAGFGTGVALEPGASTSQPPFEPPPVAEMAKLFPQLEIVELLGRGGMGAVYKARQPAIDRWVALKVLPPQSTARPGFTERFNREARALARLNHANIVALYEFGQVGGMPYFVMEYVKGVTLRRLVQTRRLEPREALKIVPQICEALQFAHDEGVVHRDIKPENILLDKKGRVKIADFGIAKIMGGTPLTPSLSPSDRERVSSRAGEGKLTQDQVLGTPNYMAPEQMEHPETVDHRADIYSLGVVFYEMLTGELPLGKFQPPSKRVQVDVRLDEVVLHALEKEPELRYQQASQVKTAVETIAAAVSAAASAAPVGAASPQPAPSVGESALARARQQVKGPAEWLVATGIVNCIAFSFFLINAPWPIRSDADAGPRLLVLLAALFVGSAIIFLPIAIIIAGLKMKRLEAYSLAIIGSILAMLIFPGSFIGLPIGIWALVVLSRREVREAFRTHVLPLPASPQRKRAGLAWITAAVVCGIALGWWGIAQFKLQSKRRVAPGPSLTGVSLTSDQVEAYVAQNKRNAESLLAAYRMSADVAYLKEAAGKFPGDREVQYTVIAAKAFPAAQRQWIDAYKASAPDNALAWYFSAWEYFRAGQTNLAVQELAEATRKPAFRAELAPMLQAVEEMNLSAGRTADEAKMTALAACCLVPHLTLMRELASAMEATAQQYRQQGDFAAAESLAGMGLVLGNRLETGGGSQMVMNQLIGVVIQKRFVQQLDPNGRDPLGRRVGEVSAAIARHEKTLKGYVRMITRLQARWSAAERATYLERLKLYGEEAALSGLKAKYEEPGMPVQPAQPTPASAGESSAVSSASPNANESIPPTGSPLPSIDQSKAAEIKGRGTLSAGLPGSGQQMVGGIFIDDVAVINNSKPVMSDDFNTGRLMGWTAPQPRVVVTTVVTNSTNYCLYMNRENNVKTYARHSVQCNDVGALELKAKVFLPQPTEQWGYNHGKQERTGIGLTTGRDEHRFNVQIVISPGELAYHVELVRIKMEIKEPGGRSETYSSREGVIAPCKWTLVSFKLDPTAGTASVYVDGRPHVNCPYDPGKITRLDELFLTTFMGNLEPAVNPKARGLPKESLARMGNPESPVKAAGEAPAQAGSSAGSEQLHFKELLSRLNAASQERIRGLGTLQCDYRLMGREDSEEASAGTNPPPVKLAASGKLTIQLPEDPAEWELDNFPGAFNTFRFEPDTWPELTNFLDEAEAKQFKAFPIPGCKLICSEAAAGSWLVSKDEKTARKFKMEAGLNPLFGVFIPTVCCHYEAGMLKILGGVQDAIGTKGESVSLGGRKCAMYRFELRAGKGKGAGAALAGTYSVWLDDATGLPLREELRGGFLGAGNAKSITTYSDLRSFGKGSFSPARSESTSTGSPDEKTDQTEDQYAPFGSQWFLTKEMSLREGDALVCKMTFSNWRQVTVPDSAFELPPGAKVISSEDTPDKGSKSKE